MSRWAPSTIATLLLLCGCGSAEGPVDWLTNRVSRVLPQDPPTAPAPTYASEIAPLQTGDSTQADRSERSPSADRPPQREVRDEDWPVMIGCGMG